MSDINPKWEDSNRVSFRNFLGQNPNFFAYLRSKRPKFLGEKNLEARAIEGSEVAGAEKILDALVEMAGDTPTAKKSPFVTEKGT